jgi:hypothetical protein
VANGSLPPVRSVALDYLSLEGFTSLLRFALLALALPDGIVGNGTFAVLS